MTKVYLTDIDVNDDKAAFLASCLHNIEKLEMWNCNLTPLGVDQLTKAIKFLPKPVKQSCPKSVPRAICDVGINLIRLASRIQFWPPPKVSQNNDVEQKNDYVANLKFSPATTYVPPKAVENSFLISTFFSHRKFKCLT